jgi:hypothetical protein
LVILFCIFCFRWLLLLQSGHWPTKQSNHFQSVGQKHPKTNGKMEEGEVEEEEEVGEEEGRKLGIGEYT